MLFSRHMSKLCFMQYLQSIGNDLDKPQKVIHDLGMDTFIRYCYSQVHLTEELNTVAEQQYHLGSPIDKFMFQYALYSEDFPKKAVYFDMHEVGDYFYSFDDCHFSVPRDIYDNRNDYNVGLTTGQVVECLDENNELNLYTCFGNGFIQDLTRCGFGNILVTTPDVIESAGSLHSSLTDLYKITVTGLFRTKLASDTVYSNIRNGNYKIITVADTRSIPSFANLMYCLNLTEKDLKVYTDSNVQNWFMSYAPSPHPQIVNEGNLILTTPINNNHVYKSCMCTTLVMDKVYELLYKRNMSLDNIFDTVNKLATYFPYEIQTMFGGMNTYKKAYVVLLFATDYPDDFLSIKEKDIFEITGMTLEDLVDKYSTELYELCNRPRPNDYVFHNGFLLRKKPIVHKDTLEFGSVVKKLNETGETPYYVSMGSALMYKNSDWHLGSVLIPIYLNKDINENINYYVLGYPKLNTNCASEMYTKEDYINCEDISIQKFAIQIAAECVKKSNEYIIPNVYYSDIKQLV